MLIHLVALAVYGSHRSCLSHVGTEGFVIVPLSRLLFPRLLFPM